MKHLFSPRVLFLVSTMTVSMVALGGCATAGLAYSDTYKIMSETQDKVAIRYYTNRIGPSEVEDIANKEAAKIGKKAVFVNQTELVRGSGGAVVEAIYNFR